MASGNAEDIGAGCGRKGRPCKGLSRHSGGWSLMRRPMFPLPALLVDISGATIGEAEARLRAHSARPWAAHTTLRSDRDPLWRR